MLDSPRTCYLKRDPCLGTLERLMCLNRVRVAAGNLVGDCGWTFGVNLVDTSRLNKFYFTLIYLETTLTMGANL